MLNLAVMREIVKEAETGDKAMPTANAALAHWRHDAGSLIAWRYSANAMFRFTCDGVPYFLRLSHDGLRSRNRIAGELAFMDALREAGYPAVKSVPADDGQRIITVDAPYARWHAVVFEAAPGKALDADEMSAEQVCIWGQTIARMHAFSAEGRIPDSLDRSGWEDIIAITRDFLGEGEASAHRFLDEAETWLRSLPTGPDTYGMIHWDFEPDNVAWDGNAPMVYDFDGCAYFWYAADIAFAIDDVLTLPYTQRDAVMSSFIEGYTSVKPLAQVWQDRIPLFVRLMRVFKYATLVYAWRGADPALDLPWMTGLRQRHITEMASLREGFAAPFIPPHDADFDLVYMILD